MRGTKPSSTSCPTFCGSVTPSYRRTATYIVLAHLLREGGTLRPRLKLFNVFSVKGYKGWRNFREYLKAEVQLLRTRLLRRWVSSLGLPTTRTAVRDLPFR